MKKLILLVALFISAQAHAVNPSFVKSAVIIGDTASPAVSTSMTPTTAGDSLIVGAFATGSGTFGTATNSAGSTVIVDASTAHFEYLRVAGCLATAQTFSVPFSGFTEVYTVVIEITPAVTFDQATAENSGTSVNPIATNSLTPSANDEFLLALVKTVSGGVTFSGWTNSFTQDRQSVVGPSLADAYLVQTSGPTSVSASVTTSTAESWFSMLGAYAVVTSSCTHSGITSAGALVVPNGSTGSYRLANGTIGTPDCSTKLYPNSAGGIAVN